MIEPTEPGWYWWRRIRRHASMVPSDMDDWCKPWRVEDRYELPDRWYPVMVTRRMCITFPGRLGAFRMDKYPCEWGPRLSEPEENPR